MKMLNHQEIDKRSLMLAEIIVQRIDNDPLRLGLQHAKSVCAKWVEKNQSPAVIEWMNILMKPWADIKQVLLDGSEEGKRLRQSMPFCGIITPQERWQLLKSFERHE